MPPDARAMSHSVGTITTFVMHHMQNIRGDLFGGELMALAEQADVTPGHPVAMVLSGGGAKTAAHLGASRALEEAGLVAARYVATSMGAVIAAGLAAGVAAPVLLERLAEVGRRGIVRDP